MKKDETVTVSKTAIWQTVAGVLAIALVISIFTGGFGATGTTTGNTGNNPPVGNTGNNNNPPTTAPTVSLEGAHIRGAQNAPVTIVEYSDFQCPFCSRFNSEAGAQIKTAYLDTGKVRLVYKHFPLDSLHPMATPAALATECASEQGKFWEYHDKVFENSASLSVANLKQWASDLKLDTAKFNTCFDDQKYLDRIKADQAEGLQNGIRGTPGFLVDGKLIEGAQPFAVFQAEIESALAS